ncbi:flavin-containing monooxygenase FMO GS-OX-like 3 [Amborella trichopoda]|nr:flavin-containing monooxygenase FMO GS-OX-like 3 [Amborella trichopoda]|eukprot:XP_006843639.2 flavin-containing monooxygenase FMO GS-OX-like 3 [Amborella trichopoda]
MMASSSVCNPSLPIHHHHNPSAANTTASVFAGTGGGSMVTAKKKVAVIGAGAAGLVAARELEREGHRVVVFERGEKAGGTWVYDPSTETDPLGIDPCRKVVHSSLYRSLRTNLPREIMGFLDFPFSIKEGRDLRRFPGYQEVELYLDDFAAESDVLKAIRFRTEVFHVGMMEGGKWVVKSRRDFGEDVAVDVNEIYDGVVVCSGHYAEPRIAEVPGVERWPGEQIHSHNYRIPEPFQDKVVIVIGSSESAADISREISKVAKEVHVSSRSALDRFGKKFYGHENMWLHSMIQGTHEDGTVVFQDGTSVIANVILHCTGYKYHFPFLETNGAVTVDDNRVGPLYKHVFPPSLGPWLSFVGLPWKTIPFPMMELQCKWVAGALSERIALPSEEEMMKDVEAFYSRIAAMGYPKHYTHNISGCQFEYFDWLATECGYPKGEEWRKEMYFANTRNKTENPDTYREEWEDHDLISQAHEEFSRLKQQHSVKNM